MNYVRFLTLLLCAPLGAVPKKSPPVMVRNKADQLLAIIYHPEGTVLICQSDVKPNLVGQPSSLQDVITKELIVLDAQKLKIPVTEVEVDRALARAQDSLKMTRDELVDFFKKQGFTLEEAKKELKKNLLIDNAVEARVKSKAHVSQRTLEEYSRKNPIERYTLSQAFVPYKSGSKALTKTLTEREIVSGEILNTAPWQDIGVVESKDFSAEKAFIKDLPVGTVVIADEADDGLVLLRVIEKKAVPFEERKNQIAAQLGQEKFMKAQNDYFEKLLKEANIRYISSSSSIAA